MIVVALLFWLGLGLPAAWPFYRHRRLGLAAALVPLAGIIAITGPVMMAAVAPALLAMWPFLAVLVSLGLGVLVHVLVRGEGEWTPTPDPAHSGRHDAWVSAILGTWFGLNVGVGVFLAAGGSAYGWDGYMIWALRAKVLAVSSSFPVDLFVEPQLALSHWDYPLAFPAFLAWFMRVGGLGIERLAVPLGIVMGMLPLIHVAAFRGVLGHRLAAILALCPLLILGLVDLHHDVYADPFMTIVMLMVMSWTYVAALKRDRMLQVAAGLALVLVVLLKNEGILWALALGVGVLGLSAMRRVDLRSALGVLGRVLVPAVIVFVVWRWECSFLGVENDVTSALKWGEIGRRLGVVVQAVVGLLCVPDHLALLLIGLGLLIFSSKGTVWVRTVSVVLWLAVPLVVLVGMSIVYVGTPHDLTWHLETSLDRTLAGIVPAVLIAGVLSTLPMGSSGNGLNEEDGK